MIEALNEQFGIGDRLQFSTGVNGQVRAVVKNRWASSEIYLHGGHVTAFQPIGEKPVLWLSPLAEYAPGKAIRGGIPIIWPWFGPHSTDANKPSHGVARKAIWRMVLSRESDDGQIELVMTLPGAHIDKQLWEFESGLEMRVVIGAQLSVTLETVNYSQETIEISQALHSYFAISDIDQVEILGLEGRPYVDKVDGGRPIQDGAIRFAGEVDRIYEETRDVCVIRDHGWGREIAIAKEGSDATVVWNPWIEKAKRLSDFPDIGYRSMVCVETSNAGRDVRRLSPQETHRLTAHIATNTRQK